MSPNVRICLLAFVTFVCTTGCATPFETFYKPIPSPNLDPTRFIDSNNPPTVSPYSDNIRDDDFRMIEYGYELIGFAQFNGPQKGNMEKKAVEHGARIRAASVLYTSQYDHTVSGIKTLSIPNSDRVVTSQTHGNVQANTNRGRVINGSYTETTTSTVPGGSTVIQQPYSIDRFSFLATYWKKIDVTRVFSLGVRMRDLNTTERQVLQRNGGVAVEVVVRDTPAFRSNILVGDILLALQGLSIESAVQFNQLISQHRGKEVRLDIVRNGQNKTISARLN
jgi:hypothetical protein